jgi:hypothetical protein
MSCDRVRQVNKARKAWVGTQTKERNLPNEAFERILTLVINREAVREACGCEG